MIQSKIWEECYDPEEDEEEKGDVVDDGEVEEDLSPFNIAFTFQFSYSLFYWPCLARLPPGLHKE